MNSTIVIKVVSGHGSSGRSFGRLWRAERQLFVALITVCCLAPILFMQDMVAPMDVYFAITNTGVVIGKNIIAIASCQILGNLQSAFY